MDWFDYSRIRGIKLYRNNVKIAAHDRIKKLSDIADPVRKVNSQPVAWRSKKPTYHPPQLHRQKPFDERRASTLTLWPSFCNACATSNRNS